MYYLTSSQRTKGFNGFTCVNSYFTGKPAGAGSSFIAARYYTDQARQKRDALMASVEEAEA